MNNVQRANPLKDQFSAPTPQRQQLGTNQLDLTDAEKLFLIQGNNINDQQFNSLRPAFEEVRSGRVDQHREQTRNQPELARQELNQFSQNQNVQLLQQNQQKGFKNLQSQPTTVQQHPEVLLNRLSAEKKQQFLVQFELLTQEQQIFAYNKFLSSPQELQQFAITQFLSLDSQTLGIALQDEIRREKENSQQQQQIVQTQQQQLAGQDQFQQISAADQLALEQQQQALQQIIDLQNSINFPFNK